MLKNIPLGVYDSGDSPIHRLQARTKLLIIVWFAGWLVVAHNFYWHYGPSLVALGFSFGGLLLAGVRPREIWRRMWLITTLLLIGAIPVIFSSVGKDKRVIYTIFPLVSTYGFVYTALLSACGVLALLLGVSFVPMLGVVQARIARVRGMLILLLLAGLFTFWLLSGKSAATPLPIGPFMITYGGVWALQTAFVMLVALYAFSLLLTMTTSPVALIEGLTMLLAPLRRLRLPVDDFALMALLALRFIPTLLEEAEQLMKAQMSRGADLMHGSVRERLQSLTMLFTPLLQGALRRASELATALEARGYESEGRQTILHETKLGPIDYAVLCVVVGVSLAALLV